MKRNHIARNVRIYSDPQLDWMSTYQVLEHWTGVSMLTFDIHGNLVDTDSVRGTVTPTETPSPWPWPSTPSSAGGTRSTTNNTSRIGSHKKDFTLR